MRWDYCTRSLHEMGLGIRRFADMHLLFKIKNCWKLLLKDSLWSIFCATKYKVNLKGWYAKVPSFAYVRWKSLMSVMPWVISQSCWLIDKGDSSFWMDKWYANGILFNHFIHLPSTNLCAKVVDVFSNRDLVVGQEGGKDKEVADMWRVFKELNVDSQGTNDKLIWMSASDGKFFVKNAWEVINTNSRLASKKKWIWSILLPSKMSLLLWRISWNVVTVDANIQSRVVQFVPKCNCCVHSQVETLDHLFLHGELGKNV